MEQNFYMTESRGSETLLSISSTLSSEKSRRIKSSGYPDNFDLSVKVESTWILKAKHNFSNT